MHPEYGLHRRKESLQRLPIVGIVSVSAAVAGINALVGVQEEHHEGQVVVEFKQVQVHRIDACQPNPNELVGDFFDALQTDNLPVKIMTRRSRHTAQDHHERLAGPARLGFSLFQIENPTIAASLLISAAGPSRLCQQRRRSQSHQSQRPEDDAIPHEQLSV
jgi:hypothetical protein